MSVALNMIIGQKEEKYLKFALESTKWLDEHVIVNTGDSDNPNLAIIEEILPKANIIHMQDEFTFSKARNLALNNTYSPWILWQDADEVHFDMFRSLVLEYSSTHYDAVVFGFYHFILDMFHYQSIDLRPNMFRKDGKRWVGDVHEQVEPLVNVIHNDYRYHHYGYTKPQKDIYDNWKLYWSLNPDERWKCEQKRNPNDIISDRVTVAKEYFGQYPEVMQEYISKQKPMIKDYKFI